MACTQVAYWRYKAFLAPWYQQFVVIAIIVALISSVNCRNLFGLIRLDFSRFLYNISIRNTFADFVTKSSGTYLQLFFSSPLHLGVGTCIYLSGGCQFCFCVFLSFFLYVCLLMTIHVTTTDRIFIKKSSKIYLWKRKIPLSFGSYLLPG